MPRSTYYYYLKSMQKEDKYKDIKKEIQLIYDENEGRYGYRKITLELRNKGFLINHKTVLRLMRILGIRSIVRPKKQKYSSYQGTIGKLADNLLGRNFKADAPNQKWATDVTEFKIHD